MALARCARQTRCVPANACSSAFQGRVGDRQPLCHAQNGRHTDSAGNQHAVRSAVRQREVVLRCADAKRVALLDEVVHRLRSAAGVRVAQHADQITMALARVIAQRVLARDTVRHVHVDVRTGRERRQGASAFPHQFECADVQRFDVLACNAHVEFGGVHSATSCLLEASSSCAIRRSMTRRDCTPPESMLSLSNCRCGCASRLRCCDSSISRSSLKILP